MNSQFHIRVRNEKGEVSFYDTDSMSGGYPYLTGYGTGKSFPTIEKARDVMLDAFREQRPDELTPPYMLHNAAGVNNNRRVGWAKIDIVEMVPTPVSGTEIHREAYIREPDARQVALAKLTDADRKALGL